MLVLTLDGWQESKGVTVELMVARSLNIPVTMYAYSPAPKSDLQ
jgi:hypothetical protein